MIQIINLADYVTTSQRNRRKIIYESYEYNEKEIRDETIIWRCNKRGCNALLHTSKNFDWEMKVLVHNHTSNVSKLKQKKIIEDIKNRCLETN
jgi:hypothetical protein